MLTSAKRELQKIVLRRVVTKLLICLDFYTKPNAITDDKYIGRVYKEFRPWGKVMGISIGTDPIFLIELYEKVFKVTFPSEKIKDIHSHWVIAEVTFSYNNSTDKPFKPIDLISPESISSVGLWFPSDILLKNPKAALPLVTKKYRTEYIWNLFSINNTSLDKYEDTAKFYVRFINCLISQLKKYARDGKI